MGDLMAKTIAAPHGVQLPQVLLPVPLQRARYRVRRFNPSARIARFCGKKQGIPIANGLLKRIVNTAPQAELCKSQRQGTICEAFHILEKRGLGT